MLTVILVLFKGLCGLCNLQDTQKSKAELEQALQREDGELASAATALQARLEVSGCYCYCNPQIALRQEDGVCQWCDSHNGWLHAIVLSTAECQVTHAKTHRAPSLSE